MSYREHFRLPNNKFTTSPRVYAKAWRHLGYNVAKALGKGYSFYAFDPDISLRYSGSYHTLILPVDAAQRIVDLWKNQKNVGR